MARLIQKVETYIVGTPAEAEVFINEARTSAPAKGSIVTKAAYAHKERKSKGEVVEECEVVTITSTFGSTWDNG